MDKDNPSFSVEPGPVAGLLGPNGACKTPAPDKNKYT